MNVFIINGGQIFGHSGGRFNKTLTQFSIDFFNTKSGFNWRSTDINEDYNAKQEVENFKWADIIIYHTPIWWFQLPHGFKRYIDTVFTEGHQNGIYRNDGRTSSNPSINYGTGGLMQGKKYLLTTSWNAPATAFTLPGEFFNERSVDDGPLFGFHKMNAFAGMEPLNSIHFHDVEKNADITADMERYHKHLNELFTINNYQNESLFDRNIAS